MTFATNEAGTDNADYPPLEDQVPIELDGLQRVILETSTDIQLASTSTWNDVITTYLASNVDSPNTRRAYRRHLNNAVILWAGKPLGELTGSDLLQYRIVVTSSTLAASSQSQALAGVRSFLSWARLLGLHRVPKELVDSSLRTPRGSTVSRYAVLSEREISAVFAAANSPRDRLLLGVMLGAGLRVAEVAKLDITDILEDDDGEMLLSVRAGKGRKDRVVPVHSEVRDLIADYLHSSGRFLGDSGPLFLAGDPGAGSRVSRRLGDRSIAKFVSAIALSAEIRMKKISPHSLRHTYAVRSLRAGGNVVAVSKLLGHASISTTQLYVDHLATSELRAAVPRLPLTGAA